MHLHTKEMHKIKSADSLLSIVDVNVAPEWTRVPFIVKGYRINHSLPMAVFSVFSLHQDTLNIWTHLGGLAWFLRMVPYVTDSLARAGAPAHDYWFFMIFIVGALVQLASSTAYHVFRCVSAEHEAAMLRVDIIGILAMISGSWVVAMTQSFHCRLWVAGVYLVTESVLVIAGQYFGSLSVVDARYVTTYYAVGAASVVFGIIPCMHALFTCATPACFNSLARAQAGMFGFYTGGFLVLISRLPERAVPGIFDIVGSSHAIWHMFVFLAGRHWLLGMLDFNETFMRERALQCS